MAKMVVVLEWNEIELGQGWMNVDNLDLLLYSNSHSNKDVLSAIIIATEEEEVAHKSGFVVEAPIE